MLHGHEDCVVCEVALNPETEFETTKHTKFHERYSIRSLVCIANLEKPVDLSGTSHFVLFRAFRGSFFGIRSEWIETGKSARRCPHSVEGTPVDSPEVPKSRNSRD
jgi:hypothetical protein